MDIRISPDSLILSLQTERRRWLILAIYSLLKFKIPLQISSFNLYNTSFSSAMIWITYAPLLSQASEYYDNSSDWILQTVNFFIYGYMLPLIFVNMISNLIHNKII